MGALLIDLAWKSALIAGAALLASALLRNRAAAERVLLLRIALAALLLLPLLALLMPALELAVLPPEAALPAGAAVEVGDAPVAASPPPEWVIDPMVLAWALAAALVLLHLAAGLFALSRWTRAARPVSGEGWSQAMARASAGLCRPVRLRVSPRVDTPISWGVAPAWVLIDPALELRADQADAVIAHEIAHVRRFDWPVLIAARLATALYWFNPLVWLVERELARQSEMAADDEAVRRIARADYAQTLLMVAAPGSRQPACAMAVGNSTLARRIRRLLDERAPHPTSRLLCVMVLLAIPAVAVPLAAARITPADPPVIVESRTTQDVPAPRTVAAPVPAPLPQERSAVPPARPVAIVESRPSSRATRVARERVRTQPPVADPAPAPSPTALPGPVTPPGPPLAAIVERVVARQIARQVPPRIAPLAARPPRPDAAPAPERIAADQEVQEDSSNEPQGASRLQRMRRWIDRLRSEAGRLENAARYYPDSSDVRNAYIKAASDARRQAQMLERDMQKLSPGQ